MFSEVLVNHSDVLSVNDRFFNELVLNGIRIKIRILLLSYLTLTEQMPVTALHCRCFHVIAVVT